MDPEIWQPRRRRVRRDDYRRLMNRMLPWEERTCGSKVPFETRAQARQWVNAGRRSDGRLKPYRCPIVGHWHLGHRRRAGRSSNAIARPGQRTEVRGRRSPWRFALAEALLRAAG